MIVLNKNKVLTDYFIDENGIITDKDGVIQKTYINQGREVFKSITVYKILMNTFYGYRDGHKWAIHHIDLNPLNNKLENLVYLTRSEHMSLHKKGKHLSEETKRKLSESQKGYIPWNKGKHLSKETKCKMSENHVGMKGKHHSSETKRKMSKSKKLYWEKSINEK